MKIGLQTFTIRSFMQHEEDVEQTCKKLQEMGIKYLELAYVPFTLEYAKILQKYLLKYDLKVISSQLKLSVIQSKYSEIIAIHKLLNIHYMAISVIPFRYLLSGPLGLKRLGKIVNKLGQTLQDEGIQLLFHHHNYEFVHFGKKTAFDYIIEYFDPDVVQILSDTYWIQKGGYDVVSFLTQYSSHIKALHLRGFIDNHDSNLEENSMEFKEVMEYAITHNFYYGVIEQNTKQPFEEINKSIRVIVQNGYHLEDENKSGLERG